MSWRKGQLKDLVFLHRGFDQKRFAEWVELDDFKVHRPTNQNTDSPVESRPRNALRWFGAHFQSSITLVENGRAGDVDSGKSAFQEGDILFGKIRPYFHKISFVPGFGIASSDAVVLRPAPKHWAYVLMLVSSDQFVAYASQAVKEGSKMPRADWNFLSETKQLLPESVLLSHFDEFISPIACELKTLSQQNTQLARARDLLLPKPISGKIEEWVSTYDVGLQPTDALGIGTYRAAAGWYGKGPWPRE